VNRTDAELNRRELFSWQLAEILDLPETTDCPDEEKT
jgi:hypothetical protein